MIDRVAIRNFKSLREVAFDLGRMTAIVGANAGGKTSILQALLFLDAMMRGPHPGEEAHVRGRPGAFFSGEQSLERYASRPEDGNVCLAAASGKDRFSFEATLTGPNAPIFRFEATLGGEDTALTIPDEHGMEARFFAQPGLCAFGPAALLRLDARVLASPSYATGLQPVLGPSGENLPVVLADLAALDPDHIAFLVSELRRVIPAVRRIRMPRAEVAHGVVEPVTVGGEVYTRTVERVEWGHRLEIEMGDLGFLPADLVGEGVLLTLGLLTVLHGPDAPRVVLFDDLERGLHPRALAEVVGCMRRALDARPDLQIVCTSHSPAALRLFSEDEVRVVRAGDDGYARVIALAEDPEWLRWLRRVGDDA
jgi:predicted ATPase